MCGGGVVGIHMMTPTVVIVTMTITVTVVTIVRRMSYVFFARMERWNFRCNA